MAMMRFQPGGLLGPGSILMKMFRSFGGNK
jgi:hypothetical protein